ncbi:tetratricopeptide repeat protein [Rhodoflexus sp.]
MSDRRKKESKTEDALVQRFEQMLAEGISLFFDLHEFEHIIRYYAVRLQWQKALKAYNAAYALYPFSSELGIEKVRILLGLGKYWQALELSEKIAIMHSDSDELFVLQAGAFMGLNMVTQAIESLLIALENTDDKEDIHYRIAELYLRSGKLQQSVEHLFAILQINPDNINALLDVADSLEALHCIPEGTQFFEARIDEAPEEFRLWRNAAIFANETNSFHKAVELFDYALALNEDDSSVWYHLGHAQMNLQRYEEAEQSYRKAIELKEQGDFPEPEMYCCLAATYEKRKDYNKASALYRKAVSMDEQCADGWYGIGMCLIGRERWYEAINFLKKSVRIDSECEDYWLALAKAEAKTGNLVSAVEAYQHASHLNPANPQTWMDWSSVYREQGDYSQAISLLKSGLEECPAHADLYYRMCLYYIESGQYKQSFSYLENALILDFDRHTVLYEWIEDINIQKALFKIISQYQR